MEQTFVRIRARVVRDNLSFVHAAEESNPLVPSEWQQSHSVSRRFLHFAKSRFASPFLRRGVSNGSVGWPGMPPRQPHPTANPYEQALDPDTHKCQ